MSSARDDRYYTMTKPRRSPPAGDAQSSVFFTTGQGGRTVLPPLSSAFPTSRFPVSPNYPTQYTQPRSSPGRYDLNPQAFYSSQWPSNSTSPQPTSSFTNYEHDRYPQPSYYPTRESPPLPSNPSETRKLPPLTTGSTLGSAGWSSTPYPYAAGDIHSPTASYPRSYTNYQTSSSHAGGSYSYHIPVDSNNYHAMNPHSRSGYEEAPRSSSPYGRSSSQMPPPQSGTPPPISPTNEEPSIKKKRKRADAAQLKVLNETYARTAFPSTEERIQLAKLLDMTARSVQIWFQNKRQSMRQTNRQTSGANSSSHQPFSVSGQTDPSLIEDMSHSSAIGYGNVPMDPAYINRSLQESTRALTTHSSSSRRPRGQEDVKWSHGY